MLPFEGGKNYIPAGGVSWRGGEWGCCTAFCLAQVCLELRQGLALCLPWTSPVVLGDVVVGETSGLRPTTGFSEDGLGRAELSGGPVLVMLPAWPRTGSSSPNAFRSASRLKAASGRAVGWTQL